MPAPVRAGTPGAGTGGMSPPGPATGPRRTPRTIRAR